MDFGFDLVKFGYLVQVFGCDFGVVVIKDFFQFLLDMCLVISDGDWCVVCLGWMCQMVVVGIVIQLQGVVKVMEDVFCVFVCVVGCIGEDYIGWIVFVL